jgi:hypothetical protein
MAVLSVEVSASELPEDAGLEFSFIVRNKEQK